MQFLTIKRLNGNIYVNPSRVDHVQVSGSQTLVTQGAQSWRLNTPADELVKALELAADADVGARHRVPELVDMPPDAEGAAPAPGTAPAAAEAPTEAEEAEEEGRAQRRQEADAGAKKK